MDNSKILLSGNGLNPRSVQLTLSQTSPGFYMSAVQVFLKHYGKRRNCSQPAISPVPTTFLTCSHSCIRICPYFS